MPMRPGVWYGCPTTMLPGWSQTIPAASASSRRCRFPTSRAACAKSNTRSTRLKADGIGLFTDYDAKYLGDPAFTPVLAELDRRKCVVYTHPICPDCCKNLVPGVSEASIEYGTDTTRTIASLVFSGAVARYGNIKFIFSHAGGTMPFLIERFDRLALSPAAKAHLPHGLRHELGRFHYDTAQSANPSALSCLLKIAAVSQVLYGTDFPFRTSIEHVEGLRTCGFSTTELNAIEHDNALQLLPRLGR